MNVRSTLGAGAWLLFGGLTLAADLRSGPQVGNANDRGAFFPKWVAGPFADLRRCPV